MIELGVRNYEICNKETSHDDFVKDYLNRTLTMFKYEGLPDSIPELDLELILQVKGYGIITEHKNKLIALWGGFAPPNDVYYRPEYVLVNNPWADIKRKYKVSDGSDAILIRNDPLQRGLIPIFNRYGTLMSEAQITFLRALINFRAMFVFTGDDDADKKSADLFMEKIEKGESGVMVTGGFENGIQAQPLLTQAGNYITQAIEAQQYVLGMLYQQIGIQSTFNMKRERQTENETNLDLDPLRPLIDAMLEERQSALNKVNEKYGTNITVKFDGLWGKYNGNGNIKNVDDVVNIPDNSDNGPITPDVTAESHGPNPEDAHVDLSGPDTIINIEVNNEDTVVEEEEEDDGVHET